MSWAYANLAFEALVVFVLPLAFATRELVLLRRDGAPPARPPAGDEPARLPWYRRPRPGSRGRGSAAP